MIVSNLFKRNKIINKYCIGSTLGGSNSIISNSFRNYTTKYSFEGHCWFNIDDKDISNNDENGYIVKLGITNKFQHPDESSNEVYFVDFCSNKFDGNIDSKDREVFYISAPGSEYYVGVPITGKITRFNYSLRSNPNILNQKSKRLSSSSSNNNNNSNLTTKEKEKLEKEDEEETIKNKWIVEMKINNKNEFNKLLTKNEYDKTCIEHRQIMFSWLYSWNIYRRIET